VAWNILLVSQGQRSRLCPLPASCAPPGYLLVGRCEKHKRPWHCVSTAQQELKHSCIINTVFSKNPKHSPIQATTEKINSIRSKPAQLENLRLSAFSCMHLPLAKCWGSLSNGKEMLLTSRKRKKTKVIRNLSVHGEVPRATKMAKFSVSHRVTIFFVHTSQPGQCAQQAWSDKWCNLVKLDVRTPLYASCGHLSTSHKRLAWAGRSWVLFCTLGQLDRPTHTPCTSRLDCTVPLCRCTFSRHQLVIKKGPWAPASLDKVGKKHARHL